MAMGQVFLPQLTVMKRYIVINTVTECLSPHVTVIGVYLTTQHLISTRAPLRANGGLSNEDMPKMHGHWGCQCLTALALPVSC